MRTVERTATEAARPTIPARLHSSDQPCIALTEGVREKGGSAAELALDLLSTAHDLLCQRVAVDEMGMCA
jgi:hypothetical protein